MADEMKKTDVAVAVRRVPENAMFLQQLAAEGTIESGPLAGRKFTVGSIISGGSLILEIERGPEEPRGSLGKHRYILSVHDYLQTVVDAISQGKL
jgi:hypothetical protein